LVNLPGETEKDLTDIINHIKDTKPEIISLNVFAPYPGTEIYDKSKYKFKPHQYFMLNDSQSYMQKFPKHFCFANHHVNLTQWACQNSHKYNHIWPNISFHLQPRYLRTIIRSQAKSNYLNQLGNLVSELINQKFS
jgi:radical SAM superfamily enzyme YgiQ (UPF0313 family)